MERGGGVEGRVGVLLMLVSEFALSDDFSEGSEFNEGVVAPESTEGGLSVHILSLSLSDSSPASSLILVL